MFRAFQICSLDEDNIVRLWGVGKKDYNLCGLAQEYIDELPTDFADFSIYTSQQTQVIVYCVFCF